MFALGGESLPTHPEQGKRVLMERRYLVLGLIVALTTLGVAAFPAAAYATPTCYTGCTTTTSISIPPTTVVVPAVTAPPASKASGSGGLALTGADVEAMVVVGAGAVVLGALMVRRSRRRHRAET